MLPVTMQSANRREVLMPGDFVQITACRCRQGHSRFGIISAARPGDGAFLVLLANSTMMAQYCLALRLIPATAEEIARAIPSARERMAGARREYEQLKTLDDGPIRQLVIARR